MPTGTLANHLAIRALARDRRRVVVQEMSHIYNDTGDASQILSGLTLMPLAPDKGTFTWADVEHVIARTTSGRVPDPLGAIVVESPVRRLSGELFERAEMMRVCAEARRLGIGLHLDGARLFIASAYTGIAPADYAAPFDTVYVSLWKYFNSLNGAILAGPSALLDGMFNVRRMFGGALWNAWPFALLARHYAEGFVDRLKAAIAVSEDFIRAVGSSNAQIERVPNGTNIFRLIVRRGKVRGRSRTPASSGRSAAERRQTRGEGGIHPPGQRNLEPHDRRQARRHDQSGSRSLTFEDAGQSQGRQAGAPPRVYSKQRDGHAGQPNLPIRFVQVDAPGHDAGGRPPRVLLSGITQRRRASEDAVVRPAVLPQALPRRRTRHRRRHR